MKSKYSSSIPLLVGIGFLVALSTPMESVLAADGDVRALFNITDPLIGPFPADQFTVPDSSQITGLRVDLPKPDCAKQPNDCEDISIINTLDGFNLQTRLTISFDGAINPYSVSSKSIFLVQFGVPSKPRILGINQVVWDPPTKTLYVNSDESLDQHAQFALIVTRGILDSRGNPVRASPEFAQFIAAGTGDYRDRLRAGLDAAVSLGVARESIVTASTFTTMSATAILEKIRDQIHVQVPRPSSFLSNGIRTVFSRSAVSSITIRQQTRVSPPAFADALVDLNALDVVPGSIGRIAYGTYDSPNYLTPEQVIPPVGTRTGSPVVQGMNTVVFALTLPAGPQPPAGWPTAIYGHGNGNIKENMFNFSSILAKHGIATIAINGAGWGFGPLGTIDVKLSSGDTVTFPAGGRSVDMDDNNSITVNEGSTTFGSPYALVTNRDGFRQTIADLIQLVRVTQAGMDVDGDGKADLDAARLYYFGSSVGAVYGIPFTAVEAGIRASSPQFGGSSRTDWLRIGANRALQTNLVRMRNPTLVNSPGMTHIGGNALAAPFFNENKPLRDLPPLINDVEGALDIQRMFDYEIWINQPADAAAFAPHLRKVPLAGMKSRPLLLLMATGDQTIPIPSQTMLLRAGDLADVTTNFRFDLAYSQNPSIPTRNPHTFNTTFSISSLAGFAAAAQEQVATFFETDGVRIIQPAPLDLFEVPIKLPLRENLEFVTAVSPAQFPVDAAAYQSALSPGSLFTISGQTNSVGGERIAGAGNLPTTLGGIMVSVNGRPAPLLYVGPNQINAQIPYETASATGTVQVIANGISGAKVPLSVKSVAPRIFTDKENMCVAQNHDGTLNSPTNRAQAGRYIGAYLIGIGAVTPSLATGAPARSDPYSIPPGPVSASLGGRTIVPTFLGMVPGTIGLAEVDMLIPPDLAGGLHGLSITFANETSNSCQIAVGQ